MMWNSNRSKINKEIARDNFYQTKKLKRLVSQSYERRNRFALLFLIYTKNLHSLTLPCPPMAAPTPLALPLSLSLSQKLK